MNTTKLILKIKRLLLLVLLIVCSSSTYCYGQEVLDFGTFDKETTFYTEFFSPDFLELAQEGIDIHFVIDGNQEVTFGAQSENIFRYGTYSLYKTIGDEVYQYPVFRKDSINEWQSSGLMYLDSGTYLLKFKVNNFETGGMQFYIGTRPLAADIPIDEPILLTNPTISDDYGVITDGYGYYTGYQIPEDASAWQNINIHFTVSGRLEVTYHLENNIGHIYTYSVCKLSGDKEYYYPTIPSRFFYGGDHAVPTSYLDSGEYMLKIRVETSTFTPERSYFEAGILAKALDLACSIDEPTATSASPFTPPLCLLPGSEPTYGADPAAGLSASRSYLLSRRMLSAEGTSHLETVSYVDGLGRPVQTVLRGVTPSGGDLADFTDYNDYGQVWRKWKPVPVKGYDGAFIGNLPLKSDSLCGDLRPYTELAYTASHPDVAASTTHPGNLWQLHPSLQVTMTNSQFAPLDCPKIYMSDSDQIRHEGLWPSKELSVVRSSDENNNSVLTFTDKLGRVLLERALCDTASHDTYYVYDTRGDLRYVLPPALEGDLSSSMLDLYAYSYTYDDLHRMIEKKLPGCGTQRFVYDAADRLIFHQDGRQSSGNKWMFSLPDAYGREVLKGVCSRYSASALSAIVKASFSDAGSGISGTGYSVSGTSLSASSLLTVNYYDTYDFLDLPALAAHADSLTYKAVSPYDGRYINAGAPASSAYGRLTGCRTYVPGSDEEIVTAYYYDAQGNVVQSRSSNRVGGYDVDYFAYTFSGKVKRNLHTHTSGYNESGYTETYSYSYDHADRLCTVSYRLNNEAEVELLHHSYDEFCRLSGTSYYNGLDSVRYGYNIRDWLGDIITSSGAFHQELRYADGLGIPQYNGNISSLKWGCVSNSCTRGYKFSYDALSRLKNAVYGEGDNLLQHGDRFTEQVLDYDKMGNILGLLRYGQTSATDYGLVDNLNLVYTGNQLSSVMDNATSSVYGNGMDFEDGATQSVEYEYDLNGNLTKDFNKNITEIEYNVLNLPSQVIFRDGNRVKYEYDSNGNKLRTLHILGVDTLIRDYCGSAVYENGELKTILNESGYYSAQDHKFHFYLKDHQGNIRVVEDEYGNVEEVNDYYPFGGLMSSSSESVQPYKYNGKELDRKNGLDWYDYGARMYDPMMGRFMTVDAMAEKYYSISPYVYCAGNPLKYIDLKGDSISVADLYARDKQGKLINQNQVEVFEFLMNTKEGKALLGNYAAKGQTIAGVSFNKDGKFHRQGVNISFGTGVRDPSVSGTTTFSLDDKNLNIQVVVGNSSDKSDLLDTFIHETAIHADQNSVDFSDDRKMNNSNAYPALRKMNGSRGYTQHWQERNVNRAMERIGIPIMQQYYKTIGVSKPKDAILKFVYGFIN